MPPSKDADEEELSEDDQDFEEEEEEDNLDEGQAAQKQSKKRKGASFMDDAAEEDDEEDEDEVNHTTYADAVYLHSHVLFNAIMINDIGTILLCLLRLCIRNASARWHSTVSYPVFCLGQEDRGRQRKKRNRFIDDIAAVDEEEEEEEDEVRLVCLLSLTKHAMPAFLAC